MELLFTALKVLDRVVNEKVSFFVAVSEACKTKTLGDKKSEITALAGCALRHFLVLDFRFNNISKENKNAAILATSNLIFAKKASEKETFDFLKSQIKNDELDSIKSQIERFIDGESLIPESLDPNGLEFLSLRYNTPLWIVKMWRKHYGYKIMRKVLVANSRHFNNYAKVNNEYISSEQFEIENDKFSKTEFDNFYLYNDRTLIKKSKAYLEKQIYLYPVIFDEMIENSDADNFRGIAAYTATPNCLISALASKLSSYLEMDYIIGKQQAYFEIKQEKNHFNLKNVHLYEGTSSNSIACVSKKVHTFFVLPDSSRFFLLRNTPDHFIQFEQSSLDSLIAEQLNALDNCSKLVELGGNLVYEVPTLSEKETKGLINRFLESHPNFTLVVDKQAFPFTKYDSSIYYAVLRKVREDD